MYAAGIFPRNQHNRMNKLTARGSGEQKRPVVTVELVEIWRFTKYQYNLGRKHESRSRPAHNTNTPTDLCGLYTKRSAQQNTTALYTAFKKTVRVLFEPYFVLEKPYKIIVYYSSFYTAFDVRFSVIIELYTGSEKIIVFTTVRRDLTRASETTGGDSTDRQKSILFFYVRTTRGDS